jgi:hypothetical protein
MQVLEKKEVELVSGGDNPGMGPYDPPTNPYCNVGGPYGGGMWWYGNCLKVR